MATVDLTGKRFGKLVVLRRAENSKNGRARWLCQCDCGNQTITEGTDLRRKNRPTRSCGCNIHEAVTRSNIKRGFETYTADELERRVHHFTKQTKEYKELVEQRDGIDSVSEYRSMSPMLRDILFKQYQQSKATGGEANDRQNEQKEYIGYTD